MSSLLTSLTQVVPVRLRLQLVVFLVARTIVNTSHRMIYTFRPAIARGLGVDLEAVTFAITARSALGLASPLVGTFGDLWGRKTAMLVGLTLFIIGMLLVAFWPGYWSLFAALLLTVLCKMIFDPAMHAYVGDKVLYRQRGLAVAITEFGWSGAFLLGIPVAGWLIGNVGWNRPYLWLALTGMGAMLVLWRSIPPDIAQSSTRPSMRKGLLDVLTSHAAIAALGTAFLTNGSNEMITIIYSEWMENAFGLQVVALGIASGIIGISELAGEGLVAAIVDRLGKRRSVGVGLLLYAVSCLALPLAHSVESALVALFMFYITFEFTIVSYIPLLTQLVPTARATMLACFVAAVSLGRTVGTVAGPLVFTLGIGANAAVAAICNLISFALLVWFIREVSEKHESDS
jgi:predicted MFS family arabinose efflux permease